MDISGRVVAFAVLENAEKAEMSTADFSQGVYVWKYEANERVLTGKFCVQHCPQFFLNQDLSANKF